MDASSEGKEIFDNLRSHIDQKGMASSTLTVSGELSFDNLSRHMNPGTQYVIIPSSSSKDLLRKVVKAMKRAKQERFDCEFCMVGYPGTLADGGRLADICPSMLKVMGIPQPPEMTGRCLICD